jgi:nitrate reductase gamma subunit
MKVLLPLAIVVGLFLLGMLGAGEGMGWVFGVVTPYVAVVLFLGGLIHRVMSWASVPVPFRIPTTCGQQKSLTWIEPQSLENPSSGYGAVGRMVLEVLCFRSLLRNTKAHLREGGKLVYATDLWLWLAAMAMHWSLLIILFRHVRLITSPVPGVVTFVAAVDGFFEVGLPVIYATSVIFLLALAYLLYRRLASAQLRYISLVGDYFPLFLLLGIGITGFFLRYLTKTDVVAIKELALSLARFSPVVPEGLSPLFYGHFFLVCILLAYFSFSKLVHMPGVFLSPTRNLANSNRRVRHANPWDHPVKVHSYEEYEDENREKMVEAGLPVDKE